MAIFKNKLAKISTRVALSLFSLLLLAFLGYQVWLHTIHPVVPNKVYRSAQVSPTLLKHFVKSQHLKTVINLRGPHPNTKWYQQELAVTRQMGVQHYDLALSSYQVPTKERLRKLVYILMTAPKPILVHCLGGADRSGLASSIGLILNGDPSLQNAQQQMSIRHFVIKNRSIGKLVYPYYTRWLTRHHLTHSKTHFLQWMCSKHPFQRDFAYHYSHDLATYNQLFLNHICKPLPSQANTLPSPASTKSNGVST